MTLQQDASDAHGEEAAIQNPSPNLSDKTVRHKTHPHAFEHSGRLRTALIVTAALYIAGNWLTTPVTSQLNASGTPSAFIAYNVWVALLLLVAIANFVLVGLWLGRARPNADRIRPDQQRRSSVWIWLGWIVPIGNFWSPKQVIDDVWRSTVGDPAEPRTGGWWSTFIARGSTYLAPRPVRHCSRQYRPGCHLDARRRHDDRRWGFMDSCSSNHLGRPGCVRGSSRRLIRGLTSVFDHYGTRGCIAESFTI